MSQSRIDSAASLAVMPRCGRTGAASGFVTWKGWYASEQRSAQTAAGSRIYPGDQIWLGDAVLETVVAKSLCTVTLNGDALQEEEEVETVDPGPKR
jgi:hypothetical protein